MHRSLMVLAALGIGLLAELPRTGQALRADEQDQVTAIDILLDPDATMVKHAEADNERLLKEFPKGFAIDKTHQPHISCLQRYVKTADLDKVYEAVGKVLAEEKPAAWKLKAYKYYYIPWKDIGLAGIVIEPTDDLIRYQKKLIDAVEPFTVKEGTAAAFVTTKEDPEINQPTIDYVATFVPDQTGKKFNPHVTIGIASQDYLKKMLDEKFVAFTFSPVGASVYHLGNFGTARKKLKSWELKPTTAQGPGSDGEAEIVLLVPAGAEVFFNGKATIQTGTERLYSTPALDPSKDSYYDVLVRWKGEDGKLIERTHKVSVKPGARVRHDFTAAGAADKALLTEDEAFKLGTEAYIYGYPLITMDATRRVMTNVPAPEGTKAPMFQFANLREYPTAAFKDVTAPNADTLYSAAWLDLSKEPWVLHLPDEGDRYYLMPMLSGWTNVFEDPGKRTTGTTAGDYAVCGPGWTGELPDGVKRVKSPTSMVWIIGRTYCTGTPDDFKAVHAIQDKYSLTPLSAWGKGYKPPASVLVAPGVDVKTPPREQVNNMDAGIYFKKLAALLKDNPPAEADAPMVAKLARLGIVPGKDFDVGKLNPAAAKGLERAVKAGLDQIVAKTKTPGKMVNGWEITFTGDYGTDYLFRAAVTFYGLGANLPQDACYPMTGVDAAGKELTGANRYTLHFASKKDLPPVNGFWSLTMYNADYFFVANPLNRYTLSQRNELKENADGSIDLYLQKDSPGKDKESNWLPAPEGKFNVMLRLYWPKESFLDGTWKPPAVTLVR